MVPSDYPSRRKSWTVSVEDLVYSLGFCAAKIIFLPVVPSSHLNVCPACPSACFPARRTAAGSNVRYTSGGPRYRLTYGYS